MYNPGKMSKLTTGKENREGGKGRESESRDKENREGGECR